MKVLNRAMKAEIRYKDTNFVSTGLSVTGAFTLINGIQTGDLDGFRQGSQINMLGIKGKLTFAVADSTNLFHVAIIYDKQANASTPLESDVWQVSNVTWTHKNWVNRKRFKIIKEYWFGRSDSNGPIQKQFFVKLNKKTTYLGNSSAYSDIATGALWLFYESDSNVASHPDMNGSLRLFYNP